MNNIKLNLYYKNYNIGTIELRSNKIDGIKAKFVSNNLFDKNNNFNWYQVIIQDKYPPRMLLDNKKLSVPYIDPCPGGYAKMSNKNIKSQWADMLPWYWDMIIPNTIEYINYDTTNYILNNIINKHILIFNDKPKNINEDNYIKSQTWLVKLDEYNKLESWIIGFEWECYKQDDTQVYNILSIFHKKPSKELYDDLLKGFYLS